MSLNFLNTLKVCYDYTLCSVERLEKGAFDYIGYLLITDFSALEQL